MVALRFAALEIDNMCRHLVWHLASFHANLIFCENFMFVMQGSDTCNLWVDLFLRFGLKQTFVCKYQRAVLSCCQRALAAEVENFIVKVHCALKVFHVFSCSCPLWLGAAVYVFTTFLAKGGGSEINLLPTLWLNICIFSWPHYRFFLLQKFLDDWPKPKQFCFALVQSNHIVWRWHYFALTCHLPPIWTQLFSTSFSAWTMAFEPFLASNSGRFRRPEPQTFVAQPALFLGLGEVCHSAISHNTSPSERCERNGEGKNYINEYKRQLFWGLLVTFVTETCLDCATNFIEIIGRPTVEGWGYTSGRRERTEQKSWLRKLAWRPLHNCID